MNCRLAISLVMKTIKAPMVTAITVDVLSGAILQSDQRRKIELEMERKLRVRPMVTSERQT
jgi:hypothetical protein